MRKTEYTPGYQTPDGRWHAFTQHPKRADWEAAMNDLCGIVSMPVKTWNPIVRRALREGRVGVIRREVEITKYELVKNANESKEN